MNIEDRPTPESLLDAIKREEKRLQRGQLKIFLGMAAGVGKTYAMLEAAQQQKRAGVDVVIGVVNTHGRSETEALVNGLEVLPPANISYRDKTFKEMNLDAIIKRRPQIVLVDELAHTNVPGARHPKRWQDVMEILEKGIDVYTTLNVQHIESLNDFVKDITGVSVKETIPDSVTDIASSIKLVDLTPDELLQRLKEGKVYLGDQSKIAISNFFLKDNLTALRELALRYAAEKVDHDLHELEIYKKRSAELKPREKLLVAVSHSPHSQKLIRTARRLSFNLDTNWIAVHVDSGAKLTHAENNMLAKNLELARELGAEVISTNDTSVATAIAKIAHQHGVTQILIGRPPKKSFFGLFGKPSLIEQLAIECSDIDMHVISQEPLDKPYRKKLFNISLPEQIGSYIGIFIYVWVLAGLNWLILPYTGYQVIGVIFLLGILLSSLFVKKGPIFFATALYALIWGYLFVPPRTRDTEDLAIFSIYFFTAIIIGVLVDTARERQELLEKRESTAQVLYDIMRKIATAQSPENLILSIKESLEKLINGTFEIVIKQLDNGLKFDKNSQIITNEKEEACAVWVFNNEKEAGWSTTTLPLSQNLYIPLKGFQEVIGVLAYKPKENRSLTSDEKNILYTVVQQLSNYIERQFANRREILKEQQDQKEQVYKDVFSTLSQGLQNPLVEIQEAIFDTFNAQKYEKPESILKRQDVDYDIGRIMDASQTLLRLLDNVAMMAKLRANVVSITKKKHNIAELIESVLKKVDTSSTEHKLLVTIKENLPLVSLDFNLIHALLHNLIMNAIEYSPPGSNVDIEARHTDGIFVLSVADEGAGIPDDMIESVFEEFYRIPGSDIPGIGLGLAIAKKIAEFHNGNLTVENLPIKGAKFSLILPIENLGDSK